MVTRTSGHKGVIRQDIQAQRLMENIIIDLNKASQMSLCSFRDMPDMSTQQLMNGYPFKEKRIQICIQTQYEWSKMKMTTTTITMITVMATTVIIDTKESETTVIISQI
ncbi:MAG: hypothetical protein EZS28_055635 [Streblomastix strix]|uniref:Uncharacterized protein n=1 Tax=Streblomastix strix TaxID=222440 RepID=A0A5J4Q0K9_9EUKA|nr:MAG: hypothetical protein EZS28_055635 [Streblomastix strix]